MRMYLEFAAKHVFVWDLIRAKVRPGGVMSHNHVLIDLNSVTVECHLLFGLGPVELPYCAPVPDRVQTHLLLARDLGCGEGRDKLRMQPSLETRFALVLANFSLQIEILSEMNIVIVESIILLNALDGENIAGAGDRHFGCRNADGRGAVALADLVVAIAREDSLETTVLEHYDITELHGSVGGGGDLAWGEGSLLLQLFLDHLQRVGRFLGEKFGQLELLHVFVLGPIPELCHGIRAAAT